MKTKRRVTPRQLTNLAKGREKLFQNQLRRKGINPNPKPQIIREIVRQSVVNHSTNHQHNLRVQFSLFDKFLETKLFTLEINKEKENFNIQQLINHLLNRTNNNSVKIQLNKNRTDKLIDYFQSTEKENSERVKKLEKENTELKNRLKQVEEKLNKIFEER